MTPEMLGAVWVRKLKDALPGATGAPVTEIGEPAATVQPLDVADEPVISSPTTGDEPATTTGTAVAPEPAPTTGGTTVEILEVPQDEGEEPDEVVAGQGARLLILESLNQARDLPEDDYLVQREAMANDLFDDLVQMLTGGRATGRIEAGAATSLPTPPRPPATTPTTAPPPTIDTGPVSPPAGTAVTTVTGSAPSLEMSAAARAKINQHIPANDPSYANVAQKVAIKAKFRAASEGLRTADATPRAQALEVLTAARKSFTSEDFDAAEGYLDTGLRILGVTQWEQHIDAAMSDLGLLN